MAAPEQSAPELRVMQWIGGDGKELDVPVTLSQLGSGPKILFAFQHWCRGCHLHGFPTLQRTRAEENMTAVVNGELPAKRKTNTSIPARHKNSF